MPAAMDSAYRTPFRFGVSSNLRYWVGESEELSEEMTEFGYTRVAAMVGHGVFRHPQNSKTPERQGRRTRPRCLRKYGGGVDGRLPGILRCAIGHRGSPRTRRRKPICEAGPSQNQEVSHSRPYEDLSPLGSSADARSISLNRVRQSHHARKGECGRRTVSCEVGHVGPVGMP